MIDKLLSTKQHQRCCETQYTTDHPRSSVVYNFSRVFVHVWLSDNNFWKPWRTRRFFAHPIYLQRIQVKFVYKGHRVDVKVTGAKKGHKCLFVHLSTLIDNFHRYSPDGATEHGTRRGWSGRRLEGMLVTLAYRWRLYKWAKINTSSWQNNTALTVFSHKFRPQMQMLKIINLCVV